MTITEKIRAARKKRNAAIREISKQARAKGLRLHPGSATRLSEGRALSATQVYHLRLPKAELAA